MVASSSHARSNSTSSALPQSSSKSSITVTSLVEAIERKALPWVEKDADERIVIPRPNFKEMTRVALLFPGVEIFSRPLKGRKIVVRDRPSGFQFVSARWPAEGMEAKRLPMILCTIKGTADFRLNNYVLRCKEGQIVFVPAGIPHPDGSTAHLEGEDCARRICDILWFCPMGEVLKCWICRSEGGKHSSLPSVYFNQKSLCAYCDALFEELHDQSPMRRKIRQGLLITLFSSVQNEIQAGRFFRWLPQVVALSSEEEADPIKRAQNYIRQHMGESLTLERMARYSYMSRSQFARRFREETGQTFVEFLNQCRIEEAEIRLRTTTSQIAGLSRHVGLKPRHFNHLFLRHTGLTPGAYRRLHSTRSDA